MPNLLYNCGFRHSGFYHIEIRVLISQGTQQTVPEMSPLKR